MRISIKRSTITLGRAETRLWQSGTPEGYDLRRVVCQRGRRLAAETGRDVEIYAALRAGGWVAEIVERGRGD